MWKQKLCLGTGAGFEYSIKEQIRIFRLAGFEGYFVNWDRSLDIKDIKAYGDSLGMIFQSIHAPFGKVASMWEQTEKTEMAIDEHLCCLRDCAANDVPIMVVHAFIGFDKHEPTEFGIENFRIVVEEAQKLGVKIAFENVEGEEYLAAVMEAFKDYDCVGFCWDTGHEMCYNHSKDMMALYGDRLLCTHINDNLGIRDYNGKIIDQDDLHLLPFDGIADWQDIVHRLNTYHFDDILTFELSKTSKWKRHDNDMYTQMRFEDYVAAAYNRACRVAALKLRDKNKID